MSNSEGGLRAPVRATVDWQNEDYWDEKKLDEENRNLIQKKESSQVI